MNTKKLLLQMWEILKQHCVFAFDTETDSPSGDGLAHDRYAVCYQISCAGGAWVVPLNHKPQAQLSLFHKPTPNAPADLSWAIIRKIFSYPDNTAYIHHAKFDLHVARNHGLNLDDIKCGIRDTAVMSWICDPEERHGLKFLVEQYCGYKMVDLKTAVGSVKNISLNSIQKLAPYALDDVIWLLKLAPIMEDRLKRAGPHAVKIFEDLHCELVFVLEEMQNEGFLLDADKLISAKEGLLSRQTEIVNYFSDLTGQKAKLGSPAWLSDNFVDGRKWWGVHWEWERNKLGKWSTKKENLAHWAEGRFGTTPEGVEVVKLVQEYRKKTTLITRYTTSLTDSVDVNGRLHGSFNQVGTATGRLSSSGPNLQNIPRPPFLDKDPTEKEIADYQRDLKSSIRHAFIARDGWQILSVDYSQIELRILAHYSRDPRMLEVYRQDGDIHQLTADMCGCSRQMGKIINFAVMYGMGPKALAAMLGVSEEEARGFILRYFDRFRGVSLLKENVIENAIRLGYVTTLIGRRRYIPDISLKGYANRHKRSHAERVAFNTPIQGSAADIISIAMRNIARKMKAENMLRYARMLSQVHDELVFEVLTEKLEAFTRFVKREMESVVTLLVPLKAEPNSGPTWGDAK